MKQHTSWIEVDKAAIKHNLAEINQKLKPKRILAVVKANAYGHGAIEISYLLLKQGINYLGVALAEEALELRKSGIAAPILVLSPVAEGMLYDLIKSNCVLSISRVMQVKEIDNIAKSLNKVAKIHININTGMNRYGINTEDLSQLIAQIKEANNVSLEGAFTHFPQAENSRVTRGQFKDFIKNIEVIKKDFDNDLIIHCANSVATVMYKEMHLDMVRIGTLIFGQSKVPTKMNLKRTWQLKSQVVHLINVKKGQGISYGAEFIAKKDMKIAIVPLGFYHGISMWPIHTSVSLKSASKSIIKEILKLKRANRVIEKAYIDNREAFYVGKTGMEHISLDVTHLKSIKVGDIVHLRTLQTAVNQSVPIVYKEGL
ncbi:MAG: alanine racemase [Clostridia bacterium]